MLQTLNNRPQTQTKIPGSVTMGPGPINQGSPFRPSGTMNQGPMMQNPNSIHMGNQMGQVSPMSMSPAMGGPPMQGMPIQSMTVPIMPGVVSGNNPSNSVGRMQQRKVLTFYNIIKNVPVQISHKKIKLFF